MTNDIYSLYCPLRNYLRQQRLDESLLAIHAHIQYLQFQRPLPQYITGEPFGYRNMKQFSDLLNFHVFPWELTILYKEILLNSQQYGLTRSLLHWNYFSGAVNKLKELENEIAKVYSTKENVLLELFRLSHRQFRWQRRPTLDTPARYWKLFSYQHLHAVVERSIGLTIEEIIKIGMSLLGAYEDKIALNTPLRSDLPGINEEKVNIFLKHFCIGYDELKSLLKKEQQYNEKFIYSYSSTVAYPLVKMEWKGKEAVVCIVPRYLFERITDGIYYEICRTPNFEHPFGDAFQEYIGDTFKALYSRGPIFPEATYENGKRTIDWIIEDDSATLFVECKTKRLTTKAKAELFDVTELELELGKIADAVVQTYKTMNDYKNGLYPQAKFHSNKPIYVFVVTLEEWFIFGDLIVNKLDEYVVDKLQKAGLSEKLISENPYCMLSAASLEVFTFLANKYGVHEVIDEKMHNKEKKYWEIENYLRQKYPQDISQVGCPFVPELDQKIKAMLSQGKE